MRYNEEADRCARLAEAEQGLLRDAYLTMEAAYRVLASSAASELWRPDQPSPPRKPQLGEAARRPPRRGRSKGGLTEPAAGAGSQRRRSRE